MSAQSNIWPFSMFAPNTLNQAINPGWFDVNINYEGNPAIQKDIVENVASFGKQLGIITEAVLELAEGRPDGHDKDPITRLRRIAAKVEELKQARKNKLSAKRATRWTASPNPRRRAPTTSPSPISRSRHPDRSASSLARQDIGPQGLHLVGFQRVAPGRHLVLAARHRIDEAIMLIAREFAQIERALRVLHARTVARRAVALEDFRAEPHLRGRERFLARGGRAHERERRANSPEPSHRYAALTPASARRSTPTRRAVRSSAHCPPGSDRRRRCPTAP